MMHKALEQGEGILRLAPAWVPRDFAVPGRRIKLHPSDYYAFGANRGGICERWFSSTVKADNGPLTTPDEGLSYVIDRDGQKVLFADLVEALGAALLGETLWDEYGKWPMFAKFFDTQGALPHHMHQQAAHAGEVGAEPKPEAYYFPAQLNNHRGDFPFTFFGLEPGTTKEDVRRCLELWEQGDNRITDLSRAYRLKLGTGWYVPAGILHAPGSLCTYEPQWGSDVFAMFQSLVNDVPFEWSLLVKDVPEEKHEDLDYILSMIDWEANTAPDFREKHYLEPVPVMPVEEMEAEGYIENWIVYRNDYIAAKELTVLPGRSATIKDAAPYGMVVVQGHGTVGNWPLETPALIRFGQLTFDEFFISYQAAQAGVTIHNPSTVEPIVVLKHFAPNPEAPA